MLVAAAAPGAEAQTTAGLSMWVTVSATAAREAGAAVLMVAAVVLGKKMDALVTGVACAWG